LEGKLHERFCLRAWNQARSIDGELSAVELTETYDVRKRFSLAAAGDEGTKPDSRPSGAELLRMSESSLPRRAARTFKKDERGEAGGIHSRFREAISRPREELANGGSVI
jgi:hypothetical protein